MLFASFSWFPLVVLCFHHHVSFLGFLLHAMSNPTRVHMTCFGHHGAYSFQRFLLAWFLPPHPCFVSFVGPHDTFHPRGGDQVHDLFFANHENGGFFRCVLRRKTHHRNVASNTCATNTVAFRSDGLDRAAARLAHPTWKETKEDVAKMDSCGTRREHVEE